VDREQRVRKFTLDNESPIQGEEPNAPRHGKGEGSFLLILVATHGGPTMLARTNDAGTGSWTGTAMTVIAPVGSRFWIVGPKVRASGLADGALARRALSALLQRRFFNGYIYRYAALWRHSVLSLCSRRLFFRSGRFLFGRSRLLFRRSRFLLQGSRFLLCGSGFLLADSGLLIAGLQSFEELLALKRENDFARNSQPDRQTAAGRQVVLLH
jgi:hypothetical protein